MTRDDEFTAWARREIPRLRRLATAYCADRDAGEDVLQNVLAAVYLRWNRVEDPNAYCARSIANSSIAAWRLRGRRREVPLDVDPPMNGGRVQDEPVVRRAEALSLLSELPRQQRAVLALRYLEGLSESETAEMLDISVGTVKSHHSRAVLRLRGRLALPPQPATPQVSRTRSQTR